MAPIRLKVDQNQASSLHRDSEHDLRQNSTLVQVRGDLGWIPSPETLGAVDPVGAPSAVFTRCSYINSEMAKSRANRNTLRRGLCNLNDTQSKLPTDRMLPELHQTFASNLRLMRPHTPSYRLSAHRMFTGEIRTMLL